MKRELLIFCLAIVFFLPLSAQKRDVRKEISKARSYIKEKNNLEKAETMMRELLKDSSLRDDIKVLSTLASAVRAQYQKANEELYLKQKYDTASFFNLTLNMFLCYEGLDSACMLKAKTKGKVPYRKKNSRFLSKLRINLYNGGVYFLKKRNYEEAYTMMDAYLDCAIQPLFKNLLLGYEDEESTVAIFSTLYSGYRLQRADSALKYRPLQLKKERFKKHALRYLVGIYQMKGDTLNYVSTLMEGFRLDESAPFFVTRIVDYYVMKNSLDSALTIINKALEYAPKNTSFLTVKGNVLLNMGKYPECIAVSDSALRIDPQLPEAELNAGTAYFNEAIILSKEALGNKLLKEKELEDYAQALPYMERYRKKAPEQIEKWGPILYNIYLNLNMGEEFEEISDLLRQENE
ncbi:MAG: hypothetical protein LUC37_00305 [Prevotella sp.]|nr:hypothetical protein [Prevotella sp.]